MDEVMKVIKKKQSECAWEIQQHNNYTLLHGNSSEQVNKEQDDQDIGIPSVSSHNGNQTQGTRHYMEKNIFIKTFDRF